MKKKKLLIVLALIAAAVGAYFLFFRKKKEDGKEGSGKSGDGDTLESGVLVDKTDTGSIVDSLSLGANASAKLKAKVKEAQWAVDQNNDWGQQMKEKANNNKISIAQQMVLESLWLIWNNARVITQSEYEAARDKVMSL